MSRMSDKLTDLQNQLGAMFDKWQTAEAGVHTLKLTQNDTKLKNSSVNLFNAILPA